MANLVQLEQAFLTTEAMQALQEWAASNRIGDISQALEIVVRKAFNMPSSIPKTKILGQSKDVTMGEMCRALGLDEYETHCQWTRMAPNEFCSAVNKQVEYAGLAIEYDPTRTDTKKFRLHAFAMTPA